jgi:hypothetical protein
MSDVQFEDGNNAVLTKSVLAENPIAQKKSVSVPMLIGIAVGAFIITALVIYFFVIPKTPSDATDMLPPDFENHLP